MTYPSVPKDIGLIPISSIYIPGTGWVALQGVTSSTDGLGNASAGVVAALYGRGTNPGDTPVLVDASGHVLIAQSDLTGSGTISAAQPVINTPVSNATVVLTLGQGQSAWKAQLKDGGGGFTSGTTIVADKSLDGGTTWFAASFKVTGASPATPQSSVVGPGPLELTGMCAGATHIRIRCSVLNSTETIAVRLNASSGIADVGLMGSIPAGSNTIGSVTVANGNSNGQNIMANSQPVVLPSDQSAIPIKRSAATLYTTTQTAISATANSGNLDVSKYNAVLVIANLTAFTGTSITFRVRAVDAFGNISTLGAGTAQTTTGTSNFSIGNSAQIVWELGSTIVVEWQCSSVTSATFQLTVYAK